MNIYVDVWVCLCKCLITSGTHTSGFTHPYTLMRTANYCAVCPADSQKGAGGGRREAVPAGSIIPRRECWLMNHIFLTWGCYCAAALSQHCRAAVRPVPACLTRTTWHRLWVLSLQTELAREEENEIPGYERKLPDKFDHFGLWVFFCSAQTTPCGMLLD